MMDYNNYQVIDLETSIKNRGEDSIGKFQASPFHPENCIVRSGWSYGGEGGPLTSTAYVPVNLGSREVKVGHNFKFDLLYLICKDVSWREAFFNNEFPIWCTMQAEYLLQGQAKKSISLDDCSTLYGGTLKDDKIKEYWKAGVDTEDIPVRELDEYLQHDVKNTEKIYLAQVQKAKDTGMLPLIESQMRALKALITMEYNGMYFDKASARTEASSLQEVATMAEEMAVRRMRDIAGDDRICIPNSAKQLSAVLFGGEVQVSGKEFVLDSEGNIAVYKSGPRKGEAKERLCKETIVLTSPTSATGKLGKGGYYGVGEGVLKSYKGDEVRVELCQLVLELRDMHKQIKTYFIGYSDLTWPDGTIHPNYLQSRTDTGRLACTQPNLQNVTSTRSD